MKPRKKQRIADLQAELDDVRSRLRAQTVIADRWSAKVETLQAERDEARTAVKVALDQGDEWRRALSDRNVQHDRALAKLREVMAELDQANDVAAKAVAVLAPMEYVGDRMADRLGAGFRQEWDGAKAGEYRRDPKTGRPLPRGQRTAHHIGADQ